MEKCIDVLTGLRQIKTTFYKANSGCWFVFFVIKKYMHSIAALYQYYDILLLYIANIQGTTSVVIIYIEFFYVQENRWRDQLAN